MLESVVESYRNFMEIHSDPRTSQWILSSPGVFLTFFVCYLYFCLSFGSRYMESRKPYTLKYTIIFYNLFQICLSALLIYEGGQGGWFYDYKFSCQPVDYSNNPRALRMAAAAWFYFFAKITEFSDTVFFILKKNSRQVNFLHVYHHAGMLLLSWIGLRFVPGGHGALMAIINSFIHVLMYGYYLITSLGPEYQKYTYWKKYLTTAQMIQMLIVFIYNFQVLFRQCDYPKFVSFMLATQALYLLYLFGIFYKNSYNTQSKKLVDKDDLVKNCKGC